MAGVEQTESDVGNLTVDNATQQRNMPNLVRLGGSEHSIRGSDDCVAAGKGHGSCGRSRARKKAARIMGEFQGVVQRMEAEESQLLVLREAEGRATPAADQGDSDYRNRVGAADRCSRE